MLRKIRQQDVPEIVNILRDEYFKESIYSNLTYSHVGTTRKVSEWVNDPEMYPVLFEKDGEICGFFNLIVINTYYVEKEADIDMFYVRKPYRGSGVSRIMVEAARDLAKEKQASIIYALHGSKVSDNNDSLWCNLFKRYGFDKLGSCMIWINNG